MMNRFTPTALVCVSVLLTGCPQPTTDGPAEPTAGETPITAAGLVDQVVARYREAEAYSDRGELRLTYQLDGQKIQHRADVSVAWQRPDRLRLEVAWQDDRIVIATDGQRLRAQIHDARSSNFGGQTVDRAAPTPLSVRQIYSAGEFVDPSQPGLALNALMGVPIHLEMTQLGLLLPEQSLAAKLYAPERLELLADESIDGRSCRRVRIVAESGQYVLWIDPESLLLRRVEYPTDKLFPDDEAGPKPTDVQLVADFADGRWEAAPDADAFTLAIDDGEQSVRHFVMPPPPLPSTLFGQTVGDFHFTDLDGEQVGPQDWQGKPAVLVWFHDHPACRNALVQIEQVFAKRGDDAAVAFYAVCTEPGQAMSHQQVGQLARSWGLTMPVVRDRQSFGRDVFRIDAAPTIVGLNAEGAVQFVDAEAGANPQLAEGLASLVDRLAAGDNLADEFLEFYQGQQQAYQQQLDVARGEGTTTLVELPETKIAQRSDPQRLKLEFLWTCNDAQRPGNILVATEGAATRILVLDGGRSIVELNTQGQQVMRHVALPEGVSATFLRTAVDGDGNRHFVACAGLTQQVHLFDAKWHRLWSYPDAEQTHDGIRDVQLVDLDGDGELELYVGFWGIVGVHRVDVQGRRVWGNRSVESVLSLAATPPRPGGQRLLLVTTQNGRVQPIDPGGQAGQPIVVGRRSIHHLVADPLGGQRRTAYGSLSYTVEGSVVVVGLDANLTESLSYTMPPGAYASDIQPITPGRLLADAGGEWWIAGADGSVHVIDDNGQLADHFNTGARLTGLATAVQGEQKMLLLATDDAVTAWEVSPAD